MGSNVNAGAKNNYRKMTLDVTEIREKSFFFTNAAGFQVSVGRSLLSHISDERLETYDGPLPQEFALEIIKWRVDKGDM